MWRSPTWFRFVLSGVLALTLLLTGCGRAVKEDVAAARGDGQPRAPAVSAPSTGGGASAKQAPQGDIVVGIPGPLSGPNSGYGLDIKAGAEIAVEEINAAGGVKGRKFRLIFRDDEARPDRAVAVVREMIDKDGVRIIIGPAFSSAVLSTMDLTDQAKVLQIVNNATNDAITAQLRPYLFRVSTPDKYAALKAVEYAVDRLGKKRIAILADTTPYGKGGSAAIQAELKRRGVQPVAVESYNVGDTDMTPQLGRIQNAGADIVLSYGTVGEISQVVKGMEKLRVGFPILNSEATNTGNYLKLAGSAAEGSMMVRTLPPFDEQYQAKHPEAKAFVDKLRAKFNRPVEAEQQHITIYNVLYLLKEAIERAGGSTDPEALRKALEGITDFRGLGGVKYSFSPQDHQGMKPDQLHIVQIKNGKFTIIGE